ncbi:bHLH-MYC_N domain-containing protein [Cephalotus follicularis]|uniref:BHLH-MYC_N domain-containing protein n=1 Tax=Cephalotus follicularis TaxID=3775 RepID=A0A1Q3CJV0_CEPFO|nr:bHLH-MYC_N domain-containing protein [Cephalotus follicularis]
MASFLKQALKTLCGGVNQWSYAVFWKIGCQNTKLLIWEECYYGPTQCSVPPCMLGVEDPELSFGDGEGCWGSSEIHSSQLGIQAEDKVQSLIHKMMMNNQVNVVGEGIIGRVAFTGNHQWILANNYVKDGHPPEVLSEVQLQFSAGMKTIAVIPVFPHGVVLLGSSLVIMEDIGYVNDVKSLILQLGCVPGVLLSQHYGTDESFEKFGVPISLGTQVSVNPSRNCNAMNSNPLMSNSCNQRSDLAECSRLVDQPSRPLAGYIKDNPQTTASNFQATSLKLSKSLHGEFDPKFTPMMNGVVGGEVIPSNIDVWLKQRTSYNLRSGLNSQPFIGQPRAGHSGLKMEQQILTDVGVHDRINSFITSQMRTNGGLIINSDRQFGGLHREISIPCSLFKSQKPANIRDPCAYLAESGLQNANSSREEVGPLSCLVDQLTTSNMFSEGADHKHISTDVKHTQNDLASRKQRVDNDLFQGFSIPLNRHEECMSVREQLSGFNQNCQKNDSGNTSPSSQVVKFEYARAQRASGDDLFDILGVDLKNKLLNHNWDRLLADEPYANGQNLGKNTSTLNNAQDITSDIYSVNEGVSDKAIFSAMGSDHLLDAVVSRANCVAKQISDDNVSCKTTLTKISNSFAPSSFPTSGRDNLSNQMQSELSGLHKSLEKSATGHNMKEHNNSVSTGHSKKNDEMNKSNRKRLKPGENPRPRPKDRQMIQDRVKELREIVPNGAKLSIDALLERTIKHMLFLQSVTKHAEKLKQTGGSKNSDKECGKLLKGNFEGGATWAFEVGSQTMVCPIIVEDLSPPRHMLVEMLCEERGFFLEIADLIRGLGLTILKGVMEAKNEKIWACFTVEANRDVTRMEIFMSLVRLLEQTVKGVASAANVLDNNNVHDYHSFSESASIPATGWIC